LGDEESRIKRFVKEGKRKKMSRDEKVKGIYGVGVLKKGKVSERYIQKTYSTPINSRP
jgi:hypothetical protein